MLSKSKIKLINSLKLGKFRKELGLFIAEGSINVIDFIGGGIETEEIYATEKWIEKNSKKLNGIRFSAVPEKELKKISNLKNPSEVLGIFKLPDYDFPDLNNYTDLALMLDDIRDPGNLGTIIRTADWFGIRLILCSEKTVDVYNPKVVQATMGSLGRVKVHNCDLEKILKSRPDFIKVFGAVLNGDDIVEIPKPQRGIILIGNESKGISERLLALTDHRITIKNMAMPDNASAESLNASIAAAIICYEFRR
jgi:RNA methyltransferase, TrmH family